VPPRPRRRRPPTSWQDCLPQPLLRGALTAFVRRLCTTSLCPLVTTTLDLPSAEDHHDQAGRHSVRRAADGVVVESVASSPRRVNRS
jgi:hypothetical protein